jgi:hypothetical protein
MLAVSCRRPARSYALPGAQLLHAFVRHIRMVAPKYDVKNGGWKTPKPAPPLTLTAVPALAPVNPVTLGGPADHHAATLRAAVADAEQAVRDLDPHGDIARQALPTIGIDRNPDGTWTARVTTKTTLRARLRDVSYTRRLKVVATGVGTLTFPFTMFTGLPLLHAVFQLVVAVAACVVFVGLVEHVPTRVAVQTATFGAADRGVIVLEQLTAITSRFAAAGASDSSQSLLGLRDQWAVAMCVARYLHEQGRSAWPALNDLHARMVVTADRIAGIYLAVFPVTVADRLEAGRHHDMVRGAGNILTDIEAALYGATWVGHLGS